MNSKRLSCGVLIASICLGSHATTVSINAEVGTVAAFNSAAPPYDAGDVVVTLVSQQIHGLQCSNDTFIMPLANDPARKGLSLLRSLQLQDVIGGSIDISDLPSQGAGNGLCAIVGVQVPS